MRTGLLEKSRSDWMHHGNMFCCNIVEIQIFYNYFIVGAVFSFLLFFLIFSFVFHFLLCLFVTFFLLLSSYQLLYKKIHIVHLYKLLGEYLCMEEFVSSVKEGQLYRSDAQDNVGIVSI